MKPATRQMIKAALFEAAFVVLGVILALSANAWHNARTERLAAEHALQSIYTELSENRALVEQSNQYHQKTSATLFSQAETPEIALFDKGFIFPARVSNNAWTTASETGALKNVPFATVVRLSNVYAAQSRYESQSRTIGNLIYERLFDGGAEALLSKHRNLAMVIATMQYRENELLGLYQQVLDSETGDTNNTSQSD